MKKIRWTATGTTFVFAAGLALLTSCSSGSPTGPSGIGQGKAVYNGQVVHKDTGLPFEGAEIHVNSSPALDGIGGQIYSGVDGLFSVDLDPGSANVIDAFDQGVVIWSYRITVSPEDEIVSAEAVETAETSNGIGQCVSECVHIYNPSSSVDPGEVLPLMAGNSTGKFNARACVDFCKENYRGGMPGEAGCNPFYLDYDVCSVEGVESVQQTSGSESVKKPKKPKSNNGQGKS